MSDDRVDRVARNEAVFRSLNEQLESINRDLGKTSGDQMPVVCECGDLACVSQLDVPIERYEHVRSDPDLFFVRPGHEAADGEEVAERVDGFNVVRKRAGRAAVIAAQTDPRS